VSIVETEKLVSQLTTEGAEHVRFTRYSAEECQGDFAAKGAIRYYNYLLIVA
jgi:hypothetical protein